jgi:RHS repeat-associated protein
MTPLFRIGLALLASLLLPGTLPTAGPVPGGGGPAGPPPDLPAAVGAPAAPRAAAFRDTGSPAPEMGAPAAGPLGLAVADLNPGSSIERDLCLTVAMGDAAAAECGDLRLVHPLPTTRTMNRARTPTLLYNSQHGHPHPVVAAHVALPRGTSGLRRVVALLRVNGTPRGQSVYRGDLWPGGTAGTDSVRIAVGYDAANDPTNLYRYTLEVTAFYADAATARGELVVVNRRNSPFGAGWWLAGLDRLLLDPWGRPGLWVGGDGSTRRYLRVPGTPDRWAAEAVDRPDTLVREADGTFTRLLPGGVRVQFDRQGRHAATVNRLGHTTDFAYDARGRLERITLPVPEGGGERRYRLVYGAGSRLAAVEAPAADSIPRTTTLARSGAELSVTDPDGHAVVYTYAPASGRITARRDRRGFATSFGYDTGGRLAEARLPMGTGQDDIVHRYRALESRGRADLAGRGAVAAARAYALYDGPRGTENGVLVGDTTAFWLTRFGAPRRIRDALGHETVLHREDGTYPALVTRVESPRHEGGQRVVTATYTARGNVETITEVNPYGDGQNATTRYEWHPKWDFATRITPPEGEVTEFAYDPQTGNRLWQQAGPDAARRVEFGYNGSELLESTLSPSNRAAGARERFAYDAQGNLRKSTTPLGFHTLYLKDALGRDTLVVTPIEPSAAGDSARLMANGAKRRAWFDAMDRDTLIQSNGPALSFTTDPFGMQTTTTPAETLWVRNAYDPAGNPVRSVTRRGDVITMRYDALGRLERRSVPEVIYGRQTDPYGTGWQFPLYNRNTAGGLTIVADLAEYTYDPLGNILTARNGDAWVERSYYPNGALRTDTLRIRTYTGADFGQHVYGLGFAYDLNGRRTAAKHPQSLAPPYRALERPDPEGRRTRYEYDPVTGQLAWITDALGNRFGYTYDLEGRVDGLTLPGGIHEERFYDADGRLERRLEEASAAFERPDGSTGTVVHDDTLFYDARAKVTRAQTRSDSTRNAYSGLGILVHAYQQEYRFGRETTELYTADALGHVRWKERSGPVGTGVYPVTDSLYHSYEPGTGRLVRMRGSAAYSGGVYYPNSYADTLWYDASGNKRFFASNRAADGGELWERSAFFYDAQQRLRVVDKRTCHFETVGGTLRCDPDEIIAFADRGAFEEHRYDALGRRVLVRTRSDSACAANDCDRSVRRFVWDGDRILYEVRYPAGGGSGIPPATIEQDTGPVAHGDGLAPYGRVAYTHGFDLDHPLGIIRMDYNAAWPDPFVVVPHPNWRGVFDTGSFTDGTFAKCKVADDPTTCIALDWPADYVFMPFQYKVQLRFAPRSWMGSLAQEQRDASGQLYRRNRQYDPSTGRFTQEDPIGLAGGLNLYGFAEGDPVNFSDPFGLCPECDEYWMQAGFNWSSQHCLCEPIVGTGPVPRQVFSSPEFCAVGC